MKLDAISADILTNPYAIVSVMTAALIGSPHCLGMCGGFVAFYSRENSKKGLSHLTYNLGRLVTYLFLGALAGFIGQKLDKTANLNGIQNLMAGLTGILLIVWGATSLFGKSSVNSALNNTGIFSGVKKIYSKIFSSKISPPAKSFLLGLMSTLLPCGWLYAFVALSAVSGGALEGSLLMFFFWLGTLPAMLGFGLLGSFLITKLGRWTPRLTGILLILAGFFSIATHLNMISLLSGKAGSKMNHCAHHNKSDS